MSSSTNQHSNTRINEGDTVSKDVRVRSLLRDICNHIRDGFVSSINLKLDEIEINVCKDSNSGLVSCSDSVSHKKNKEEDPNYFFVVASEPGVIYFTEYPGATPFIKEGMNIKKGDPLFCIEVMKMVNMVLAEEPGIVEEILVQSGQHVDYGCNVVKIKKNK